MKTKHLFIFLFLGPLLGVLMASGLVYHKMVNWRSPNEENVIFEIKPGENFAQINGNLKREGLISTPRLFHRLSQYKNTMTKFRSGKFIIPAHINMLELHDLLLKSKSLVDLITIPEGKNMYEIAKILEEKGICSYQDFMSKARDKNFLRSLNIEYNSVEGFLYPNTYDLTGINDPEKIISTMVQEFNKQTMALDLKHQKLNFNEILILASMVEKETGHGGERQKVAGVFFNRLNIKMRLQSDPTTIYGIYERYKGNITKADLLEKTPYNTYAINGLPAGPISNPGIESIKAVLNPEPHNYFYFVSMNDGTHVFSETYEKHRAAVEVWQKNSRNREGRSWRDLNEKKN